jgi:hypothetical protein
MRIRVRNPSLFCSAGILKSASGLRGVYLLLGGCALRHSLRVPGIRARLEYCQVACQLPPDEMGRDTSPYRGLGELTNTFINEERRIR